MMDVRQVNELLKDLYGTQTAFLFARSYADYLRARATQTVRLHAAMRARDWQRVRWLREEIAIYDRSRWPAVGFRGLSARVPLTSHPFSR